MGNLRGIFFDRAAGLKSADRQPADAPGVADVLLHVQRRDGQHVADVVEAVAGIVGGQTGGVIHAVQAVEPQQVAHGVAVFGLIQSMNRRRAGIGMRGGVLIELGFEPLYQTGALGGIGAGIAGRRHFTGAQFVKDLFKERRLAGDVGRTGVFQGDAGGFGHVAVAVHAVLLDGVF